MFWSSGWDFPKENFEVSNLIESVSGRRGCPVWKASPFYSVSENHPKLNTLKTPRFKIYLLIFSNFFFLFPFWLFGPKPHSKSNAFYYSSPVMSLKIYIHSRKRKYKVFHFDICGFWNHWHKGKHFHLK